MFKRSKYNPILRPATENFWECKKLYNPGAIFHNNLLHLFYRAVGEGENWSSVIGYAVSNDGEHFQRFNDPLLTGINAFEKRGLEDPRITKIDDLFYMAYAAYDGITPRLSVATSSDLKKWQKHGPVFSDWLFEKAGGRRVKFIDGKPVVKAKMTEWSKSGAIFPERIDGKYLMLFGEYNIWFAESNDGVKWVGDQVPFLSYREGGYFDNAFVEMGPPPIKTNDGWLILYHGIDNQHVYRIGFLLLDLINPRKILYRTTRAIFEPEADYELSGIVDVLPGGLTSMQKMSKEELDTFIKESNVKGIMPKVTFCCGAVVTGDELRIFYGASDSVICTAVTRLKDILNIANCH